MNLEYVFIAIVALLQGGILYYLFTRKKAKATTEPEADNKPAAVSAYYIMRHHALQTIPGAIVALVPEDSWSVYAVLIDWTSEEDTLTLHTQITGETCLYLHSGGGIIGAGKYPQVALAAQHFTAFCDNFLAYTKPVTPPSLPPIGNVHITLLTNKGKFTATALIDDLESGASVWKIVFEETKKLVYLMKECAAHALTIPPLNLN